MLQAHDKLKYRPSSMTVKMVALYLLSKWRDELIEFQLLGLVDGLLRLALILFANLLVVVFMDNAMSKESSYKMQVANTWR